MTLRDKRKCPMFRQNYTSEDCLGTQPSTLQNIAPVFDFRYFFFRENACPLLIQHIIQKKYSLKASKSFSINLCNFWCRYIESLYEEINQQIQKLIEQKKRQVRLAWMTKTSSSFMSRHLTYTSKSNQLVCILM